MKRLAFLFIAAALLLFAVLLLLGRRPVLTEERVRTLVATTIQREARAAFIVTGTLELAATTYVSTEWRLLPGIVGIPLGSVSSTVRVPGRVAYGIAVDDLDLESIRVYGDTIELRVPEPRIFSVEPLLDHMEVQTEGGWLRLRAEAREHVQQRAISMLRAALETQGAQHLADADQPRINTAETLHELLRPVFAVAGTREPVFRFVITDQLMYHGAELPDRRR
jgi:hypothetical protein